MRYSNGSDRTRAGFTILELLIIISIVALLAGIILAFLNSARKSGRDARRKGDIDPVRKAMEQYYQDSEIYPSGGLGGGTAVSFNDSFLNNNSGIAPQYIQKMPKDPSCASGNISCNYQYITDSSQTNYGIYIPFEKIPPCKFVNPGAAPSWNPFPSAPLCVYL